MAGWSQGNFAPHGGTPKLIHRANTVATIATATPLIYEATGGWATPVATARRPLIIGVTRSFLRTNR